MRCMWRHAPPTLFEEVRVDLGALQLDAILGGRRREMQSDVLSESGRVVVALRLTVAERLEDRVGLQDALVEAKGGLGTESERGCCRRGRCAPREIPHEYLGRLSLAGAALTRDDNRLGAAGGGW